MGTVCAVFSAYPKGIFWKQLLQSEALSLARSTVQPCPGSALTGLFVGKEAGNTLQQLSSHRHGQRADREDAGWGQKKATENKTTCEMWEQAVSATCVCRAGRAPQAVQTWVRAREENTKPTNDASDPQKGFLFLEVLREQVSAAAGGDTPQRVIAPSKEHRGLEKCRGAAHE